MEPEVKSIPLTPIEIQDLELATGYEVFGRCRMEKEEDLWSDWSPILSLQTLPLCSKRCMDIREPLCTRQTRMAASVEGPGALHADEL